MPEDVVIGLKSLHLRGSVPPSTYPKPSNSVFTEDEVALLLGLGTDSLRSRLAQGQQLINLLSHPAVINLSVEERNQLIGRLRFQMDEIQNIINHKTRQEN
jgi:hypothetical protein